MSIILADLDYGVKPCEAWKMLKHGSEFLRRWREKCDFSQPEAAEILECTHQQVSHWETKRHVPDADRRFKIQLLTKGEVPASSWSDL